MILYASPRSRHLSSLAKHDLQHSARAHAASVSTTPTTCSQPEIYSLCIEEARLFLNSCLFSRSSCTRLASNWEYSLAASLLASARLRFSAMRCRLCCSR